jgi:hypothetical protein
MHEQYAKILELSYCYNQKIWKIITKKAVILSYLEQHLKDYNQKAVILLYGFSHRHHAGRRLVIIYSYIMSCPFAPLRARAARRWSHRPSRTWWDARAEDTGTYVPSAIASPRACSWCTSYTAPKTATPPQYVGCRPHRRERRPCMRACACAARDPRPGCISSVQYSPVTDSSRCAYVLSWLKIGVVCLERFCFDTSRYSQILPFSRKPGTGS